MYKKLLFIFFILACVMYATRKTEGFLVDSDNMYYPSSIFLMKRGDKYIGSSSDSSLAMMPDRVYADVFRKIGCNSVGCNIRSYTHDTYWATSPSGGNLQTRGNVVMSSMPETIHMIYNVTDTNKCFIRDSQGMYLKEDASGYLFFDSKEPVEFEIEYLK